MKRYPACLLAVLCVLSLLVFPAEAAAPKVIGKVLTTDIRAYINGAEIPAYNIDGNMVIVGSDLRSYGFSVVYNNDTRTSSVTLPANGGKWEPMTNITRYSTIGEKVMDVYATDIKVLINGTEVQAFNVDNKMAFRFNELKVFGSYQYDNASRTTRLTVQKKEEPSASKGLLFTALGDGTCSVGYGTCTDTTCTVPRVSPDGKKVVHLDSASGTGKDNKTRSPSVLVLPDTVQYISDYAFDSCSSLKEIRVDAANPYFSSKNGALYTGDGTVLLKVPAAVGTKFTVADGAAEILDEAFLGVSAKEIVLPASVTRIGAAAFFRCTALQSISLPAKITEIGSCAFAESGVKEIVFAGTKAQWNAVDKAADWNKGITVSIRCKDGNVSA